jgi:hypothetical protein
MKGLFEFECEKKKLYFSCFYDAVNANIHAILCHQTYIPKSGSIRDD